MHIITIAFGSAPSIWQFVFRTEEAAKKVWDHKAVTPGLIEITDDFGQTAVFREADICGRMIENMDLSKQAHLNRHLHQQRMQAEANKQAEADPAIRAAMAGRGPAILSPMGGFNGRGN